MKTWKAFPHSGSSGGYYIRNGEGVVIAAGLDRSDATRIEALPELYNMLKTLREAVVNTPALDGSADWTALVVQADTILRRIP